MLDYLAVAVASFPPKFGLTVYVPLLSICVSDQLRYSLDTFWTTVTSNLIQLAPGNHWAKTDKFSGLTLDGA